MNTRLSIKEINDKWNIKVEGLPNGSTFEFQEIQNGYQNHIYQIINENGIKTDGALIVEANKYDQHNGFYNNYTIDENYYARRKSFAQETGSLAKKYNINFPTALALNADKHKFSTYSDAREKIQAFALFLTKATVTVLKEDLSAGITRRKQALKHLLGEKIYNELGIERMGQINSERIAQDCIKQLDSPLSQDAKITPYFQQLLVKSEVSAKIQDSPTFTEESDALKLSIVPLNKSNDEYAIIMPIENQADSVLIATFKASFVDDDFSYNQNDLANASNRIYFGKICFNDTIVKTLGESLYSNKTFGELNSAIYRAFTNENLTGFNLHLTASQLGIEQDIPLNENIVYEDDNLNEH